MNIVLSVSVLDDVFYSEKRPEYLNFGALGFIVSHEMNHGFDISVCPFFYTSVFQFYKNSTRKLFFLAGPFIHRKRDFVRLVATSNKREFHEESKML